MKKLKKLSMKIFVSIFAIAMLFTTQTQRTNAAVNTTFNADIKIGDAPVSATFTITKDAETGKSGEVSLKNGGSDKSKSGKLAIPNTVTNGGNTYDVTSIGEFAFEMYIGITSTGLETNTSVTTLGKYAFRGCTSLETTGLATNKTVASIDSAVFRDCTTLANTGFETNTTLTSVGDQMFWDCTKLTSTGLETNKTVKEIKWNAFTGCSNLLSTGLQTNDTVTKIYFRAFLQCTKLTSTGLETNSTVTSIGEAAFSSCTNLTSIIFSGQSKVAEIGDYAFEACTNLEKIFFGNTIPTIGSLVFTNTTSLYYPKGATNVDQLTGKGTTKIFTYDQKINIADDVEYHAEDIYTGKGVKVHVKNMAGDEVLSEADESSEAVKNSLTLPKNLKLVAGKNTIKAKYNGVDFEFEVNASAHNSSAWIVDKNATTSTKGSRHKECTICKKSLESEEIAMLLKDYSYTLLEGKENYKKNANEEIVYKIDGDYDLFKGVIIDGKEIDKDNYVTTKGSTIVTLKAKYIESLKTGQHEVVFVFDGNEVKTTLTIKESTSNIPAIAPETPTKKETKKGIQTGDHTSLLLYVGIFMMSTGVGYVFLKKRKAMKD